MQALILAKDITSANLKCSKSLSDVEDYEVNTISGYLLPIYYRYLKKKMSTKYSK